MLRSGEERKETRLMMSQWERGVEAAGGGNATIRASRGRRTAECQRRRGSLRSKEELRNSTAQRFRSTAAFFAEGPCDLSQPGPHLRVNVAGDRAGGRGLRSGVPSEPRTKPCVVTGLARGPHSGGGVMAPSAHHPSRAVLKLAREGRAIGRCWERIAEFLARASGWCRAVPTGSGAESPGY